MKFNFFAVVVLSTLSLQSFADVLVCENAQRKIAFDTESTSMFSASSRVSDSKLLGPKNILPQVEVSYDADSNEFSASGEDGCTPVSFSPVLGPKGEFLMEEINEETSQVTGFNCRWI